MARQCAVDGCERTPGAGWSRCDSHVRQWLDRLLGVEWRKRKEPAQEPPTPIFADWAPGEVLEVFGK